MSFFYDLNKRLDSIRATPEVTHQQLNERDLGKHNNATTGFAALAKKTGGGEKGARIAGAQLAKMRAKGQVEEGSIVDGVWTADPPKKGQPDVPAPSDPDGGILNKKTPAAAASRAAPPTFRKADGTDANPPGFVRPPPGVIFNEPSTKDKKPKAAARNLPEADMDESAFQAAIGKKKYGDQGMKALQKAGRNNASDTTMNNIRNRYDKYDESMGQADEGNAFSGAVVRAKRDGIQPGEKINVGGKEYPVKEAAKYRDPKYKDKLYTQEPPDYTYGPDMDDAYYNPKPDDYAGRKRPMGGSGGTDPLEKGFGRSGTGSPVEKGPRKGLPKRDQITSLKGSIKDAHGTHKSANFADRIAGAKKEVDEMLGQVAADAMKNALGGGRGRNAEMDEGHFDDTPTRRRSSSGGEIDTSKPGSTVHRAVKGNYSGAAHSGEERRAAAQADAADERGPRAGRRTVGAGKGTKIGAKINRGTAKLMTREGDQDPADQGEYDREGEMGRNEIHTMMRNAKQLEKMLGNNDDLPEWVQKKLSLASDYMQTIADYLASERETDAEDETGRRVEVELAEKKAKPTKQSSGNDGNLANNAKPYDKVTRGDVVAGRLGKDEMGGKKKSTKPSAKKEEEVDESTTAGSVATAPTSGKARKGSMSFGKGIYDSIDRAVERQINESMNISMSMNNDGGGAGQTLTITATDEDATQLAQMLKMAGLGGGDDMSHSAASGGQEVCAGCGMADCGCGNMEQMDETYGDNVVDMNSPNYPTNTESAENNFGYSGGLNKPKHDVAGDGQSTVPVTAVRVQDELSRIREMAGMPPAMPVTSNKAAPINTSAQKAQQKQNESIFTDTENLWKRYKG